MSKTRFVSVVFCSGAVIVFIMLASVRDSISLTASPKDFDSSLLSVFDGAKSTTGSSSRSTTSGTRELHNEKTKTDSNSATTESTSSIRSSTSASSTKQSSSSSSSSSNSNNDWKLWHEMTKEEQDASTLRLKPYVERYGELYMKGHGQGRKIHKHGECDLITLKDKTSAGHSLCGPPPTKPCNFFSFGINDDPSFDVTLAEQWGCRGFAADPTVDHPSKLHPLVTFHNIGLKTLEANEERLINKGGEADWWMMSIPGIFKALDLKHLNILKIDCEGCEVALARDILLEDRYFLHKVDQISYETHTSRSWINSTEAAYYFGLIFPLLEEAGFELEWSHRCGCSKRHEITGCHPNVVEMGFPCGYDPWPGKNQVVLGRSCQDALYYRYPEKATVIPPSMS
eukprot:CAMPEP_0113503854 /NCGR_PEP_ID=MMETSP0014_2-20120614/34397_1 /TAXON_ID=2857 /ORGANISM="Nitzschia sp." /LENGTH=398 /DNA_ID=CAMNT_0000398911 /DNA_START=1 /DNA_END=1197 /DNA_ORIENTATION=+ /assembly_acc=CAM_ASM_000159